jgi:hypothetical protein
MRGWTWPRTREHARSGALAMPPTHSHSFFLSFSPSPTTTLSPQHKHPNPKGGHRAIVFNRLTGIKDTVYEEGTHLMVPWLDRPIIFDVRARPNVITSQSGSRDLQMVNIGLRVLTRPAPARLPEIYRTLGTEYAERVLPSIIQETLKSVIAQVN